MPVCYVIAFAASVYVARLAYRSAQGHKSGAKLTGNIPKQTEISLGMERANLARENIDDIFE